MQRYKTSSEEAELREDDLKVERRKLQREVMQFFDVYCKCTETNQIFFCT